MRLAAQAKMGYYPTPEHITPIIAKYLRRSGPGCIRIFDPCAGEGTALHVIGNRLKAETYGIELDIERGTLASHALNHCLITDYQNTKISHNAFSVLWLNPPYDWATRDSDLETSERYEKTFLRYGLPYLCMNGILVYLIPQHRIDRSIAQMLSYRFKNIAVYRFPLEDYEVFRQVVIFGVLKKRPAVDGALFEYVLDCSQAGSQLPELSETQEHGYDVPLSPVISNLMFTSREINPDELEKEMQTHGVFQLLKDITTPLQMAERIQPIMPLRYGHLAQILACGLMNGIVRNRDGENPLLVKGVTTKTIVHTVEANGEVEKHIETDCITITIHAFTSDGKLLTIR